MALKTGAVFLAEQLEAYGVTHVFMVPAILRRTLVEIEMRTKIKRLHVHSEKSAVYMADGFARAAGRPAICMAQVIGALNIAAGLREPFLANSPVIAFTGGRSPKTKFRHVYQEIDDVPAFEPVTKFNATIDDVERFPDMLEQAYRNAVSGCPGPVHLQFQGNEGQIDLEEGNLEPITDMRFDSIPPFRPQAEKKDIERALDLLQQAERPVIVSGGGVKHSKAGPQLLKLAESLRIPVATSLNGKDTFLANHPLSAGVVGTYSRGSANRVVSEADLICFIGSKTGGMTTHFWQVPPIGSNAIQIDIDPEAIGRNYTLKAAVQGDARSALEVMISLMDPSTATLRDRWNQQVKEFVDSWYAEYDHLLKSDATPIRPERLCNDLTRLLPDDSLVVVDTGHAGMWMGGMFDVTSTSQNYVRSAGHLGWAFPAGLGAKCALPERPVVCFTGDAGFWYHIAEIETAVRWNINSITLVNNNSAGNQSKTGFDKAYGGTQTEQAKEIWNFTKVNFANIANEIGALGIRVEKPSDFNSALDQALSANQPVIIDVVTDVDAIAPIAVT
ncbi:MAG TPA: thiamine pyrophosphate-binding protein [Rhodospirillales bacterium]|nr:MAG: Acetolactate synthase isozyme 3 large subunit [Alphaproteobacteria bacterium MarineAlpha3_Bin6]HIM21220.1 thiamine pyrophosphate-binding protein [Rhodospirillales bacterium]HIN75330.1 thiamine pyrophosphate-binding protein [Rhodospirillales bacterium]HIP10237.1 thiamine pyrophosphate-binding protein [Rhodospirillales bacterium]